MRLFAHRIGTQSHLGAYRTDRTPVDLGPGTLLETLQAGSLQARAASADQAPTLDPDAIEYLPPVTRPQKIICVGLNYRAHRVEGGVQESARYPDFFVRFPTSMVGHGQALIRPHASTQFDYEGELAVIIGREVRHVTKDEALNAVAGYSVFNEGSIRDYQFRASQWTWGKNFDATAGFGPDFVTPDELPRSVKEGLKIETRLNGETLQSASTAALIFDLPTLIEMLTEAMTLLPGDVIVSGTPSGVGFVRKPPIFMKDGDTVEVEIEGVGLLRNSVRNEKR